MPEITELEKHFIALNSNGIGAGDYSAMCEGGAEKKINAWENMLETDAVCEYIVRIRAFFAIQTRVAPNSRV